MATEAEMRLHRCCFTGHRPHKLGAPERKVQKALEAEIKKAIDDGFTTFITGMAQGVDIWAGEIVLHYRKKYDIKLICACPYEGFENAWDAFWQKRYRKVLEQADLIRYICEHYSKDRKTVSERGERTERYESIHIRREVKCRLKAADKESTVYDHNRNSEYHL